MKKTKPGLENKELSHILKQLTKRIEAVTVDIHDMRFDLKAAKLRLNTIESNTEIMKVDIENISDVAEKVKKDTDSLIGITSEILANMVTQKEFNGLSQRVTALEN